MNTFISCDWGTSTFRLRLATLSDLTIIAEENNDGGIAAIFKLWKQSGRGENDRLSFYQAIIEKNIAILEEKAGIPLQGIPLVISGMASSTIGMMELAYKEMPVFTDGSDLHVTMIKASPGFPHHTLLISGCRIDDDVMRGEETIVAGVDHDPPSWDQIYILPGTHSKHISISGNRVTGIKTYMTGEFFDLLSSKSILSVNVEKGEGLTDLHSNACFEKGVSDSLHESLLHSSFLVRTNDLFQKLTKQENYYYLSGLLIGSELKELMTSNTATLTLISNHVLKPYYQTGLRVLQIIDNVKTIDADEAIVRGQHRILVKQGILE